MYNCHYTFVTTFIAQMYYIFACCQLKIKLNVTDTVTLFNYINTKQ